MKATNWEFKNRAMVFGWIFGFTFPIYALNASVAAFAVTLKLTVFFVILGVSVVSLFVFSALLQKKASTQTPGSMKP